MNVKINTGVVGRDFAYSPGDIVDQEEFAAKAGTGWQVFCAPAEEMAVKPPVRETAVKYKGKR